MQISRNERIKVSKLLFFLILLNYKRQIKFKNIYSISEGNTLTQLCRTNKIIHKRITILHLQVSYL